jgi:hypothetical protein
MVAYVIFQVKEFIDGCGKETDICFVSKEGPNFVKREVVRDLELLFREHDFTQNRILHHVFSGRLDSVEDSWASVSRDIRRVRRKCEKLLQPNNAMISLRPQA